MIDQGTRTIYQEVMEFFDNNDEPAIRAYLRDNLLRFPKELQREVVRGFVEESIQKDSQERKSRMRREINVMGELINDLKNSFNQLKI